MLQKQKGYVMGICIDGVPCTFKGVLKMAEEERKTSEPSEQPRLGFPRNQGKLRGRRQRRVKAAIVPSDADKGMSVERYPDSGHRSRLSKFILDVIAQNSGFVICVWHSHRR